MGGWSRRGVVAVILACLCLCLVCILVRKLPAHERVHGRMRAGLFQDPRRDDLLRTLEDLRALIRGKDSQIRLLEQQLRGAQLAGTPPPPPPPPAAGMADPGVAYTSLYGLARAFFGYESPLPPVPANPAAVAKFSKLPQLFDLRLPDQLALWRTFVKAGYVRPALDRLLSGSPNGMYPDLDRVVLYCMLRHHRPRRMVEIGSGESTYVARAALAANAPPGCVHQVIEPYRANAVPGGVRILQQELQVLDLGIFDDLEEGDVLFIDSSHVITPYGDTLTELVAVLPRLRPGVLVHIHDIFLPGDYPQGWGKKNLVYSEQWAVSLMLWGAEREWRVVWASRAMEQSHGAELLRMPAYPRSALRAGRANGGSLWLRKLGSPRRPSLSLDARDSRE